MTQDSNVQKETEEYNSLRAEILSIIERSHSFWKWGLVSLLSVFVPNLAAITRLPKVLEENIIMIAVCFIIPPAVFAGFISRIAYDIAEAADRLGSYLTVFHERRGRLEQNKKLGWHTWNRIEKNQINQNANAAKSRPVSGLYKQKNFYAYVLILFMFYAMIIVLATTL
ncbi:MAG: hypothetical protein JW837_01455 [Sedimentisphaerales bacterium]|nr:hypothetical protein [Sedimentisphaerales bacterium]